MRTKTVEIKAPNLQVAEFTIVGNAPLVTNKFSNKAKQIMKDKQMAGSTAKKGNREGKDFQACFEGAKHVSVEGWCGIPASAFRCAMISACKISGFPMTKAKLSVFCVADGFEKDDGTPLVKITKGEPVYYEALVRNETGVADIRARPMWREGWEAVVRIKYDADQFTLIEITNLLLRAGLQVGLCEGRPDSKDSAGIGFGTFEFKGENK